MSSFLVGDDTSGIVVAVGNRSRSSNGDKVGIGNSDPDEGPLDPDLLAAWQEECLRLGRP
jgi:NADPH:quinone reductase-like Zn-dependent oxidoreductase